MNRPALARPPYQKKTIVALLFNSILSEPLFCLYGLTAFILRKDLEASAFQISLLMMLRPIVSILSFYWSSNLSEKKRKLRSNLLGAGFLSSFLFLFFPWIKSVWFVIAAAAFYILFYRASVPAWVEILKRNLPKNRRERVFSWGAVLGYAEGILLTIAMGTLLDKNHEAWKFLFFGGASLGMVNLFILSRIPIRYEYEEKEEIKKIGWRGKIKRPWKDSFQLMRSRSDFAHFQWGFLFCGFGIMLVQPAIAFFLADHLNLTYVDIAIALSICKGTGFAISSPIWARAMNRFAIQNLSSIVFIFVGFFPLLLIFAYSSPIWVYLAYFFYGIAQGGSHLIWNLSGPIFAGNEESSRFSAVNVVMVGIRGTIAPLLGGWLAVLLGPIIVLSFGVILCFYGGCHMLLKREGRKTLCD